MYTCMCIVLVKVNFYSLQGRILVGTKNSEIVEIDPASSKVEVNIDSTHPSPDSTHYFPLLGDYEWSFRR